ncbi:hypothetical protein [Streptomyces zaomyceticus]|uniref:hypothetical protein n=1 Tax=Streptomyces zaomyceticus TaxID=68286 RepID=UPI00343889C4
MQAVTRLIAEWQLARSELAELERAEHPYITDRFGRVWRWKGRGDIYVHCGSAVPKSFLDDGRMGLPAQRALDNPNYDLCGVCLDGRQRNVKVCTPEWGCSHKTCQR